MKLSGFLLLLVFHHSYSALDVVAPRTHNALIGSTTLVPCSFVVDSPPINPQFLAILWQYDKKELVRYDNKEKFVAPRMSIDEGEARRGNASLTIHNVTISDQGAYKCLVVYSPDKVWKEIQVQIHAVPKVTLVKKALSKNGKNRLLCRITNIFPKDIKVTWLRNGQALGGAELGKFEMDSTETYSVNSSLTISPKQNQGHPNITCQVEHESLPDPIQDTLTVQYGEEPKITLFSSHDEHKEIFVCEVKKFYPEALEIKWLINGKRMETLGRNADGTYNKWDLFLIPGDQKNTNNISCVVEHETLDSPLMKSLTAKNGKDSQTPALIAAISVLTILLAGILAALWIYKKKYFQQFQLSPIHIRWNRSTCEKVTMYCTASNCPGNIQVTWTVREDNREEVTIADQTQSDGELGHLLNGDYTVRTEKSETDGLYNAITSLTFTTTIEKHCNMKVTCSFLSEGKTKKRDKEWSLTTLEPRLSAPLKTSLCDNGDVECSVTLEKFRPKNIQIRWSSGVGNYQEIETTKQNFIDNSDFTCMCESECRVPGHLFQDPGFRVRVTWGHQSLGEPENLEVSATDLPWCPVMGDITMPMSLVHNREAKLQCEIRGYFPNNLEVKWLRRKAGKQDLYEVSSSDKCKIPVMDITQETDRTYNCTAHLIVYMSAITDQGVEFICRVTHPTLRTYQEKRTGVLTVKGKPYIRSILQNDIYIVLEVDNFYTQDPVVTWEASYNQHGQYRRIEEEHIQSYRRESEDGSYSLTSICETMTPVDFSNPVDKYVKVTIKDEVLEFSEKVLFLHSKGCIYILSESGKEMLKQIE